MKELLELTSRLYCPLAHPPETFFTDVSEGCSRRAGKIRDRRFAGEAARFLRAGANFGKGELNEVARQR